MNRDTDIVQIRYHIGGLQYRQRKTDTFPPDNDNDPWLIVLTHEWTDWESVPATTGDESDERFE